MKIDKVAIVVLLITFTFCSEEAADVEPAGEAGEAAKYNIVDGVMILNNEDFDEALLEFEFLFIKFFAPWCGHCKHMAAAYKELGNQATDEDLPVKIAEVDCDQHKEICSKNGVRGYPTVMFFRNGQSTKYQGGRTKDAMLDWIKEQIVPAQPQQPDQIEEL